MLNLFRKVCYGIEKRKYTNCLKRNPEDAEMRIGFVDLLLKNKNYNEAFEQYKIIKSEYKKGSRLEELLKAKDILKDKGYEV